MKKLSKEELEKPIEVSHTINFLPRDLSEDEVNTLFTRCLATNTSKKQILAQLSDLTGTDGKHADRTYFDFDLLNQNRRNILYLFGQLMPTHFYSPHNMAISNYLIKYDDSLWTKVDDDKPLLESPFCKLLYLGKALDINSCMKKDKNGKFFVLLTDKLKPTLSPNDPDFNKWWAEHKSEWEDQPETKKEGTPLVKRPGGTEPGDQ